VGLDLRKVYVNLIVCADESGTHDTTGVQPGASVAIVAGIAAFDHSWIKFESDWRVILDKYNVPYFHFRELVAKKRQSTNPKWHYYGWSERKRHDYLTELAIVAGVGNKLFISGALDNRSFHQKRESVRLTKPDVYQDESYPRRWVKQFFQSFYTQMQVQWPHVSSPIHFIFDQNDDPEWKKAVMDIYDQCQTKIGKYNFEVIEFRDKKTYLPLQAADMVAYRFRQLTEHSLNGSLRTQLSDMDRALFKYRIDRILMLFGE
jgi:hypothetical protein